MRAMLAQRTILAPRPGEYRLWADLNARTTAGGRESGLYAGLARRLAVRPATAERRGEGVWQALVRRADLTQERPRRATGVAEGEVTEDGERYTALRSPTGRYLRLTAAERELWELMDGTRSVGELATHGFLRFRQLLPVAELVQTLRRDGFLSEAAAGVYLGLRGRLEARTVRGLGQQVLSSLRQREFAIGGVDAFADALHRGGGWLLFTRPFLVLLTLIALAGLGCFALVATGAAGGAYSVIDAAAAGTSLLALWAALLVSFALHELAHALTVKHFGRTVLRGGVMIYYGLPAAFVDTSDIWLAGRRARILTSLAGPVCDLTVGSLAAIAAALLPVGAAGDAAYKLAVASYLAALCNLNPLLELDGYYMLSDWLALPNLRRRALAFISGPLWQKLRSAWAEQRAAREHGPLLTFSREERIFTLYGGLSAIYTALAIVLALFFWQAQLVDALRTLWAGDTVSRALAVLIFLGVVVPLGLGLIVAAWGLVRAAAAWVARRGYGRSPIVVAGALTLFAVALATLPLRFGRTAETALIAPLLWLVALVAQVALHNDYRRAAVARALDCFLAVTVIEGLALLGFFVLPQLSPLWSAMENLGFALLLFAGFVTLLDHDLRQAPPAELAGSALLMALAFLAGGLTIGLLQVAQPGAPFVLHVLNAAPVYTSAVALALLLPQVAGMHDSRLLWSWLLLWLGIALQTAGYLLELLPAWRGTPPAMAIAVLASGLWAAAWCSHAVALRQLAPRGLSWPLEPATGEAERLRRAFRHSYAGLYRLLRAHHGSRRARALDDRMDVLAATANWQITLDREEARIGAELAARPLDDQGTRYAEVLRYAVAVIEGLAGVTFARRAIQAAYDALPWPEREAADRRCFPNTPWARELSRAFGDARDARLRLLRQVEQLAACDDGELLALAEAMEPRRAPAGALLLAAGEPPPGLWIVEAGEVVAREGPRVAAELHRGDGFGAAGTGDDGRPSAHAYRASVDSELLYLSRAELRRLLGGAAPHAAEGPALMEAMRALERAALFHDLPRETLRGLARAAERLSVAPRTLLIRQGRANGRIFLILRGEAAVLQHEAAAAGQGATGGFRVVARLGPDELVGELELLGGGPPQASVVALTPLDLVALPHGAVADLLSSGGLGRGLERLGSARLRDLRG
jgi:putative peptide zinc metalloprotease protein